MDGLELVTGLVTKAVNTDFKAGWIIFGIFLVFILIFTLRHFLEIVIDLWKMPFAIVLDALRLVFIGNQATIAVLAVVNVIVFWMLARKKHMIGKFLGILAGISTLAGTFFLQDYISLIALVPISSILMFLSLWAS